MNSRSIASLRQGYGRQARAVAILAAAFILVTAAAWAILSFAWPDIPINVHVRWTPEVSDARRADLERRFHLTEGQQTEGTTWDYQLADTSTANIRAIIQDPRVDDTEHLNRIRYRPAFAQDRARQRLACAAATGAIGSVVAFIVATRRRRESRFSWSELFTAGMSSTLVHPYSRRTTGAALIAASLIVFALTWLAGASLWSAAGAVIVVYIAGYGVGSLLLDPVDGLSGAMIRTSAGLLLSTIAFLLSLVLSLPWFVLPAALIVSAVALRRSRALLWPDITIRFGWDGALAGVLSAILLSPIVITVLSMGPGSFPPVFYNIDTAYTLEKVHALVAANTYPPPSLSNLGIHRTYHYGTQAMAALISRSSGLLRHQSLFLIVLPLLTLGVLAAAIAVVRYLSPALPRSITVPLLLISAPSAVDPLWDKFGPQLWHAVTTGELSFSGVFGEYGPWGILSNEGPNVGGDFLILGSVAAIAAAPYWGWRLAAFLIGTCVLVKTPAGVALMTGFVLAETWRALATRRFWPSSQLMMSVAVFAATFVAFFVVSFESNFRVELTPLFHLREIAGRGRLAGLLLDTLWLFLPVLIVVLARIRNPEPRSAPILFLAIAPFLVVNATRLNNIRAGGGGTGDDWFQILHSVPFLLHAFALSLAGSRWDRLGRASRVAFLVVMASVVVPVTVVAGRYSLQILQVPESGNDFVDNRTLGDALAAIPTSGSVIVTNDLRYPAQRFTRDDRQMQIPALFGHQAFAVNYAHEAVEERRPLQELLQRVEWSEEIVEAARRYRWTHFLVRKDFTHPAAIPLEQVFENEFYSVYRF